MEMIHSFFMKKNGLYIKKDKSSIKKDKELREILYYN